MGLLSGPQLSPFQESRTEGVLVEATWRILSLKRNSVGGLKGLNVHVFGDTPFTDREVVLPGFDSLCGMQYRRSSEHNPILSFGSCS